MVYSCENISMSIYSNQSLWPIALSKQLFSEQEIASGSFSRHRATTTITRFVLSQQYNIHAYVSANLQTLITLLQ